MPRTTMVILLALTLFGCGGGGGGAATTTTETNALTDSQGRELIWDEGTWE